MLIRQSPSCCRGPLPRPPPAPLPRKVRRYERQASGTTARDSRGMFAVTFSAEPLLPPPHRKRSLGRCGLTQAHVRFLSAWSPQSATTNRRPLVCHLARLAIVRVCRPPRRGLRARATTSASGAHCVNWVEGEGRFQAIRWSHERGGI